MIEKIRFENLSLQFADEEVLKEMTFSIRPGCYQVVSSKRGGKSLVLRLLAGSVRATLGGIYYNDQNVSEFCFEEWKELRLKIGYSFDYGGLLSNRSLEDNLLLPLQYHNLISLEEAEQRVDELLKKFDLDEVRHLRPSEVTGSRKKAACVARSLILKPEVLLLDDPTTGLKPSVREAFYLEIQAQMKEALRYVIYCSEDEEFQETFKAQVIHCHRSELVEKAA